MIGLRPHRVTISLALALIMTVLGACGPEPTPFPVELPPTPTATPPPEALPPLRVALAPNMGGTIPDFEMISGNAQVVPLLDAVNPDALGVDYDMVIRYGHVAENEVGWIASDLTPRITLVINPDMPPLDRVTILRDVVRRSIDVSAVLEALNIAGAEALKNEEQTATATQLRTEMANAGLPDGFALALGTDVFPGLEQMIAQMSVSSIELNLLPMNNGEALNALTDRRIGAALMIWALASERETWVSRFGDENVIDLYTLPLSYQVVEGLTVTFSPAGIPIVSR